MTSKRCSRPAIEPQVRSRRLLGMATAKQGMAIEATYRVELRDEQSASELVKALNLIEGVQTSRSIAKRRKNVITDFGRHQV